MGIQTLIELYDERPVENVLSTEVFRPDRTVFLCSFEIAKNRSMQKKLKAYFRHRGLETELLFIKTDLYHTQRIKKELSSIIHTYPNCAIDITGGTDAALFAAGMLCAEEEGVSVFTYSRKQNTFYNIHNAPYADRLPCEVQYGIEDCFLMAGGDEKQGRVDNRLLKDYVAQFSDFFALFLKHKSEWGRLIHYIQRASHIDRKMPMSLFVSAGYTVKGERGYITVPEAPLYDLQKLGWIQNLEIVKKKSVSFSFADEQIRTWLRDIGSVLELYVYRVCVDTGLFHEVKTSVIVDWEGTFRRDSVSNEIDVIAMRGISPVFISCKTGAITTEALNELAVLRDRFGGNIAKAVIVTAQHCRSVTVNRAAELNIDVVDLEQLKNGRLAYALSAAVQQTR